MESREKQIDKSYLWHEILPQQDNHDIPMSTFKPYEIMSQF